MFAGICAACAITMRIARKIRAVRIPAPTARDRAAQASDASRALLQTARIPRGRPCACARIPLAAACVAHTGRRPTGGSQKVSLLALLTVASRPPVRITLSTQRAEWNRMTTNGSDCGKIIARRADIRRLRRRRRRRQQHYAERQK